MTDKQYSQREELLNAWTHGLGIIFGIIAGFFLVKQAIQTGNTWAVASVFIYIVCMLMSYVTSTIYHSCTHPTRRVLCRKFDHAAIYFHIAGTYTPFTLIVLREVGIWGWLVFSIVWIVAIVGTGLSFAHYKTGSKLETICYVLMGSIILIALKPLVDTLLSTTGSLDSIYWLLAGGISYIIGAIFYSFKKIRYMHSAFHLFVLGGSVCHVLAIWDILR